MGVRQISKLKRKEKMDKELSELIRRRKTRIKVVGSGGAGCNTISRLMEMGIEGVESVAINTDALDLYFTHSDRKVLIGKELTKGLGCGADPLKGAEAARESKDELKEVLRDADLVFLTCGLGGGTGTGSLPVIAEIAKKLGALTIGIVTLPFSMEGKQRRENAMQGLEKLESVVDTLIVVPNDKLLEVAPKLSLVEAFKLADEVLANAVKGIVELVTKPGLVNRDFADVRSIMENGGYAMIGLGESSSENRAYESVQKALNHPLMVADVKDAKGALINVVSGPEITVAEHQQILEYVSAQLSPEARIIWGAQVESELGDTIKTLLILTGVPPMFKCSKPPRRKLEKIAELEYIE